MKRLRHGREQDEREAAAFEFELVSCRCRLGWRHGYRTIVEGWWLFHGGRSTNITTIQHILSTIFRTFANLIHSIQKSTVNPTPLVRISLPNFSQISRFPTYFRPYHLPRHRPIKPPPQTTNRLPLVLPHLNPKDARPTLPSPYPYFRPTPPPYFIAPPTKSWAFNSITVPPIPLFN